MAKALKTKIGFELGENFHSVISVHETAKGELIISPSFAVDYSEREFGNFDADKEIKAQHYTMHHPRDDEENMSNHTLEYSDGARTNTRIYTRACKAKLFAPLFVARGQDFSIPRYASLKVQGINYLSLGKYEPKRSTLYYMIVVGDSGLAFTEIYADMNVITVQFAKYSVSVLWSFGAK